ncbi:MAG: hypothetical protein JXA15_12805 [Spirochaetales bacterium]|nr:hypothetical protein [Spirochaetales bacterium]
MKPKSPAVPSTLIALAFALAAAALVAGCQNINVDTEKLLSPIVSNGRADGRFVPGTNDEVTITDPNDGSTVKYSIDGGATLDYSGPFTVNDDATVEAWVEKPGLVPSARTAASFRLAWRVLDTSLTIPRYYHAVVSDGSKVWVMGGMTTSSVDTLTCEVVDLSGESPSISDAQDLNAWKKYFQAALVDSTIYALGGDDASVISHAFGSTEGAWATEATSLASTRNNSQAAVIDGSIFIPFGTLAGASTIDRYQPGVASEDIALSGTPPEQACPAVFALDKILYSVGSADSVSVGTVLAYDTDGATWSSSEAIPVGTKPVENASAVALADGRAIVINKDEVLIRAVDGTWRLDGLPVPDNGRRCAGAALINGKIYVFGGIPTTSTIATDTILEFSPP